LKEIPVFSWKETVEGEEMEVNTISVINTMLNMIPPQEMPRGFEYFKVMKNLSDAFEKADKNIILEEREYEFLLKLIKKYVPASWATDENVRKVIETFMELENK